MAYTPEIRAIAAFDATHEHTFTYVLNAIGFSVKTTEIEIYLNSSDETTDPPAYSGSQDNYNNLYYNLPSGALDNGEYYKVRIRAKSINETYTNWSATQSFRCFTSPTLTIGTLPIIIDTPSYTFTATYNQVESEPLNSYIFSLYNESGIQVATSGIRYTQSSEVPLNLSEPITGIENGTFDIEVVGTTLYGTNITSGKVRFTVQYATPSVYGLLQLQNECDKGYITITSNITDISGDSSPSPPIYISDGQGDRYEVDVRDNGAYVIWKSDYVVNGDFTLKLWGSNLRPSHVIAELGPYETSEERISVMYRETSTQAYVELYVYDEIGTPYYIYSDMIDKPIFNETNPINSEQVFIWVRRIDNIYDIKIENLGVV